MGRAGVIKASPYNWVQQNHDGLELRAGWPEMSNLIHGQWLDTWEILKKDNPVVPMSGNLRSDLFEHLVNLEKKMDFCLSVGTSHSGLNVDRLVKTSGTRFVKKGAGLGLAMVTIQKTPYDDLAALRIFSKCDDFMMIVCKKLGLRIDLDTDYDAVTKAAIRYPPSQRTETMIKFCRDPRFHALIVNARASGELVKNASGNTTSTNNSAPLAVAQHTAPSLPHAKATSSPSSSPCGGTAAVALDGLISFRPSSAGTTRNPPQVAPPPPAAPLLSVLVGNYHQTVAGFGGSSATGSNSSSSSNNHQWTMFVSVNDPNAVDHVVYHLHPTFSPSVATVSQAVPVELPKVSTHPPQGLLEARYEYQLTRVGWGTFEVGVEIYFTNGKTVATSHELSFLQDETSKVLQVRD
jgi:hypothetical protein